MITSLHGQPALSELEPIALHIVGANGKLGRDLGKVAAANGIFMQQDPGEADFVALCTPSHVSQSIIDRGTYDDKVMIDLSGAAKQSGVGQYGLMNDNGTPWDKNFNTASNIYGNPGCIASAVIRGLGRAGLTGEWLPHSLNIFSVGGQTHTQIIEQDELKLARRLLDHPHVGEIERAFDSDLHISSFMPTVCDVPNGLLVGVQGTTAYRSEFDEGADQLAVSDVVGTDLLKHRLEMPLGFDGQPVDFSLGVVIDNLRFVTSNAVRLLQYLARYR